MAVDFDGTLAEGSIAPEVAGRLAQLRQSGLRLVVVTGRILHELFAVAPELLALVDAVVGENGAVIWTPPSWRRLAPAPDPRLLATLRDAGVLHRTGDAILATTANREATVLAVIRVLPVVRRSGGPRAAVPPRPRHRRPERRTLAFTPPAAPATAQPKT